MKKTNRFLHNFLNRFMKTAAVFLAGSMIFSGILSCALDEGEESGKNTNIEAEEKNGSKSDKMAYLVLSASTASRALYPEADENDLTNLTLSYKKPNATSWGKICDFESYDELTENSSLALTPDTTYDFKLTGKIDSSEFAGEITVKLESGKNELNFSLKQTSLGSGKGSVTYTVTFPTTAAAGIKAVKVSGIGLEVKTLVPSGSVSENDSKKDNSTWITSNLVIKKGSFTYTASNVPAGSYKIYVSFYADTEYNSEITKYPETVNVSSGLTTSGTYTVTEDNLNQIYSINYVLGDGDFVSGYTVREKYTRMDKGSLALPAASDVQNHARMLIGWSTENDAANSNIITDPSKIAEVQENVITSIDTSEQKNVTLYAKWFNGYVIDTAKNAEVLDSLNLSAAIGKYKLRVKGAATGNTLTSLNTIINTAPSASTCQVILSLTDTSGLTTIDTQFKGNAKLAGLTIPASVTSIGDKAFDDCTALKTLVFEDGTESISLGCNYYTDKASYTSEGLFYDCPLTSLYLGRNLSYKNYSNNSSEYDSYPSYYGWSAFANIQSEKNASDREDFNVEIGKYVTSIPKYLLYNCLSLKSVTISTEAQITSIGKSAFNSGERLSSFDIPSTVKNIDDGVFFNCSALSSISIPAATTAIGDKVFDNCAALKTVRFEDGTESISLGCNYYTDKASYTSEGLFYDCPLTSLYLGRNLLYKNYSNNSSEYDSYPSYYGWSAFANIQSTKNASDREDFNVEIGKYVTSIPKYLLYNCLSLKSVAISSEAQITSIGKSAFNSGERLSSFDIPSTVKNIDDGVFFNCSALSSISIPATTTAIGDKVFNNCTALKTVRFEDGTESISLGCNYYSDSGSYTPQGLFYDCPLTSLYLGRNLTYKNYSNNSYEYDSKPSCYGWSAFAKIQSTKNASDREDFSVEIGKYVTSIPKYLLYNCYSLKSVTISPEANINTIGENAFYNGEKLSSFDIPSTVKTINDEAFSNCIELSSITIPAATTAIGDKVFDNCTGLKTVVFEDGTETLSLGCNVYTSSASYTPEGLFYDCPLTSLYLGRNLSYKNYSNNSSEYDSYPKYYGYSAFANIQSTKNASDREDFSVEIGKDVTSIPKYLLYNCLSLKSVAISSEAQITSIGKSAFNNGSLLESFAIPSTVESIEEAVFANCTALSSITIPAATTAIGDKVFNNCTALKTVRFEDGTETISLGCNYYSDTTSYTPKGLFYDCPLTSLYLGRNLSYKNYSNNSYEYDSYPKYYGYSAFARITSLADVTVSPSVTSLRNYIFYGCSGIKKLTLAEAASEEESTTLTLGRNGASDAGLFSAPTALEEFYLGRSISFVTSPFSKIGYTTISSKVTIGENFTDIPNDTFFMLKLSDSCQMTALGEKHWYRADPNVAGYTGGTEITADVTVSANAKAEFIGDSTYNNAVHRYYRQ